MEHKLKKIRISLLVVMLTVMFILTACTSNQTIQRQQNSQEAQYSSVEIAPPDTLLLSTTTSTENSGLLDYILPVFTEETGIDVKVVAVGTGQALQMGRDGDADVLLVHAKASEEEFVADGHGIERFDVMYNDYVLLGPVDDPAWILETAPDDILEAFQVIYDANIVFISRGDDSGTHKMELALWQELGLEPSGSWYVEAGQGMGAVIQMADEMIGYTLTDRATYLSMKNDLELGIVTEGDTRLFNQYGIIAVNPGKNGNINSAAADLFIQWILSDDGQQLIGAFGKDAFGQSLFIPNANR